MMNLPPVWREGRKELGETYPQILGGVLRDMRTKRGFTLRETATRSAGIFKASVLAAYERGERSISLERFHALAGVYEIPAHRLLAEVVRSLEDRRPDTIDVGTVGDGDEPVARALHGFVQRVMTLRGADTEMITLRAGDLQVLSTSLGISELELRNRFDGRIGADPS
jgi:transcriptional regulator with XRE-family HTH domain